jgi:hypothetical protein
VIGVLAVVCCEEVDALVEFLGGVAVRQQRRRGGGQFEVLEDLVNDVRVGKEGQHDHTRNTMPVLNETSKLDRAPKA